MHLVRVGHCLFFINRDNTSRHIKITARESKNKKLWFNYSEMYPSFYEDCIFMGVGLVRTPIHGEKVL